MIFLLYTHTDMKFAENIGMHDGIIFCINRTNIGK